MTLPGLNFDVSKYQIHEDWSGRFAMIPFSDWLPPDFEDVLCIGFAGCKRMYFSPATQMMVPSDSECAGAAYEPKNLRYWLKALK